MAKITDSAGLNGNQSIKRQNYIKNFRQKFPEESKKLSDAQIITIMDNKIDDVEYRDGTAVLFRIQNTPYRYQGDFFADSGRNFLILGPSGRYRIYKGDEYEPSCYAADGTKLKPEYFNKVEEDFRMNKTITKPMYNLSIQVQLSDNNRISLNHLIDDKFNKLSDKIKKAENENGFFASLWSGIKNKTGIGDSSNKAKKQLEKERQIIKEKGYIEGFTEITGLKATPKNIEAFKKGEVKLKSEQMLEAYKEGQEMAVDIEGDLISGALAFTAYSAAVMAAPFTAGASIAVGAAAAAAVGAIAKPVVKGFASAIGDYEYKGFKKDVLTGAFSGVLAPISAGLGGAVGKTTAKALGVEAVKHIGKKGVEQTAKTGLKETIKTGLLNPAGYKYTANSFIRRETALASELVTDGVTAGTIDGGFRGGVESDWQLKEMGKGALIGGVGGFVLSPVIGRTLRTTGKLGHKYGLLPEERLKLDLSDMYEKATPVQKEIIEEILSSEALQKNNLIHDNYSQILNPNKGQFKIEGIMSKYMGEDACYFSKTEVQELLAARLKILKQLKENPDLAENKTNYTMFWDILVSNDKHNIKRTRFLGDCNIKEVMAKTEALKQQMLEHPQMYVSGEYSDDIARKIITNFFTYNRMIYKTATVFDNETLNSLMRKRLRLAGEYLDLMLSFTKDDLKILRLLCNSKNADGKAFTPNQKVEFIDLVYGYRENGLDVSLIDKAIKDGKVDLAQLHKTLLNKVFANIGLTEAEITSIPAKKMECWDLRYLHLLAKSISDSDDGVYHDMLSAAMLDDFMRYLHDGTNVYGKTNLKTKQLFEKRGWDYEAYIKPKKENEVRLVIKDQNSEQLIQSGEGFVRIIEQLAQPPLDKIIRKQLSSYMKGDKFVIPEDVLSSKDKLYKFMTGVLKNLDNIKKRAEGNLANREIDNARRQNAKNTVTKFSDLLRIAESVKNINVETEGAAKSYNLTIKMMDRVPQKDIFQGNYSTCCIGQGEFNDRAMAYYLMNTSCNMIEIVDNDSGKTIGNALCYFVEDKKGTPYFMIDNIEINNAHKGSREASKKIREAVTEYASKVVKQITGRDDINICMSSNYNDVPTSDLSSKTKKVKFVGEIEADELYMDLFGGWESDFKGNCDLLFLK